MNTPRKWHKLKIWPEYLDAIIEGRKTFEVRKADRDFQVGDALQLEGFDPVSNTFTENGTLVDVTYVMNGGKFGVEAGTVVLGIRRRTVIGSPRISVCPECDQPMLPPGEVKRPNEYDHANGCPVDRVDLQDEVDHLRAFLDDLRRLARAVIDAPGESDEAVAIIALRQELDRHDSLLSGGAT